VSPNIYVLLPVNQDHISWHGSFEKYKKSKLKAMDNMSESEIAIIPKEFEYYPTMAKKIVYESSDDLCNIFSINKSKINFKEPFLLDAILSLCISSILFDEIDYKVINEYEIDEHTLEEVYDFKNRLWINDSKATNINATMSILDTFKNQKIYLILGGYDKGIDLEPLIKKLSLIDNIELFFIGLNFEKLLKLSLNYNLNYNICNELEKAVLKIDKKLDINSICILSPAFSSLDQFISYKERGDLFKRFIKKLSCI
jgi:UDP-N-acetylmuramoylalanine--D-glutamate ligase